MVYILIIFFFFFFLSSFNISADVKMKHGLELSTHENHDEN